MSTCADSDEKVTLTHNPATGEHLMLCAYHAELHRKGFGFNVYEEAE